MSKARSDSIRVNITVPSEVHDYLVDLVGVGLYGNNPTQVAKTLMTDKLKDMVREGVITLRTPGAGHE